MGVEGGSAKLLSLDWARGFDSIDPEALLRALRRFSLPGEFAQMVAAIYGERHSFV